MANLGGGFAFIQRRSRIVYSLPSYARFDTSRSILEITKQLIDSVCFDCDSFTHSLTNFAKQLMVERSEGRYVSFGGHLTLSGTSFGSLKKIALATNQLNSSRSNHPSAANSSWSTNLVPFTTTNSSESGNAEAAMLDRSIKIVPIVKKLLAKFDKLISKNAFVHNILGYGLDYATLRETRENVELHCDRIQILRFVIEFSIYKAIKLIILDFRRS